MKTFTLRIVAAFFAFNIFTIFLLSSFINNTHYLFDAQALPKLQALGVDLETDIGWDGHYFWRFFSSVIVTSVVSILTGAISKKHGGIVATVSNIPISIVLLLFLFLIKNNNIHLENETEFLITSLLIIPITMFAAYFFGNLGQELQLSSFPGNTVLGIHPWHWAWIVFPLYLYTTGIIFVSGKFFMLLYFTDIVEKMNNPLQYAKFPIYLLISLLAILPVFSWLQPIKMVYKILKGEWLNGKSSFVIAITNTLIIVVGFPIALGIQAGCFRILDKLMYFIR